MLTMIGFNLSLLVICSIVFGLLWWTASRQLFFDLAFFLVLLVILIPVFLIISNIIFIEKNNLSMWNYIFPLGYALVPIVKMYGDRKKQKIQNEIYNNYAPEIRSIIKAFFKDLSNDLDEEAITIIKSEGQRDSKDIFKVVIDLEDLQYNEEFVLKKLKNLLEEKIPEIKLDIKFRFDFDAQKKTKFDCEVKLI
ncbi:RNA helicase [Bacillus paramobilis]|uniref:RNA helicase n=1 Tax=Bacillus paramobilis TaxID=2817477 RepID=UPI00300AD9B2